MTHDTAAANRDAAAFLSGDGEMAARIRAFDWSASLGPIADWPASLKTTVGLMVHSPVPIVLLWGLDGVMIYNDAYSVFAGGRHPALLGSRVREGWPEVADFNDNVMRVGLAGGRLQYKDQELILHRSGAPERVWMNLDYSPVIDESGGPGGVIAIVIETTERVLAERRAVAEQERQQRLLTQMPGFAGVLHGPEHVFEYVNEAYRDISGRRDLLGLSVRQAFPDIDGQGFYELLDQVYATGERYVAHGLPISLSGDDAPRFIDLLYEPIRDEQGAVTGIFVGGYDATEAYRTSAALADLNATLEQRVEERTRALKDSEDFARLALSAVSGVGVWTYDVATDKFTIDAAISKLYGHDPEAGAAGLSPAEFLVNVHPEDRAALAATLAGGLKRPGDLELEYRLCHPDGSVHWVLSRGHTYFKDGKPVRRTGVGIDTTRNHQLEDQLRQSQKMEAVGQLTGGIAHDFNNLLTAISGSLELLETRIGQGRLAGVERYISAAQSASRRAAALTQRLLAFSRRQTLDPRPTDVNKLVAGLEELIRRTVGPTVELEVVGAGGLWPTRIDPSQLENALLNLCINGRDAMAPAGGRLTIETANKWLDERAARDRDLAPGQYVSLCVTDTGTGMNPETVARAFDPFFTTKPLGEGTGLGLSMVYGFVRQSGGQVRIYTELGSGTTMCLYLPRYVGDLDEDDVMLGDTIDPGDGETVLVIDDEPAVRMLIVEVLEDNGYNVIEAGDGAAGLRVLETDARVDLLITDVGLPGGMNGRQVADAARVSRPDLKVLFITGYAENAAVGNGHLEVGMEVITKPFVITALAAKIRELIDRL